MKIGLTVAGGILLVIGIVVCIVTKIFEVLAWGGFGVFLQSAANPAAFYGGIAGIAAAILGLILLIVGLVSHKPQN